MGANQAVLRACLIAMGAFIAPVATSAPAIVSSAVKGVAMSVVPATFSGAVTSVTYQWNKNGTAVPGATAATYAGITGDEQASFTRTDTAFNVATPSAPVTSAAVIMAPASAAYATALAAVADGQYFTAPSAANSGARLRVYQRLSGVGVLVDVTPASGTVNAAAALVRSTAAHPVAPLVDFDSTDAFYGENEFQSRVPGDPLRTFNLLGYYSHANGWSTQGSVTVVPRVSDSSGGTLATQVQMPSGTALLTWFLSTRIPPGTWTLSFKAKTSGQASTQTMQFGQNGTTGMQAITVTSSWQQFSLTFNNTAETFFNCLITHGEYPAVSSTARDITIDNLQCTPGTVAPALADTTAHPSIYGYTDVAYNGMELHSATAGAANGNALNAKIATITTLSSWSVLVTCNGTVGASAPTIASIVKSVGAATYIAQAANTNNSQSPASTLIGANIMPGSQWGGAGRITFGLSVAGTTATAYINGVQFETQTISAGAQSNMAAVLLNAYTNGSSGTQFTFLGDTSSHTFWASALTGAQMAAAHAVHLARATAKGLTLQPTKNVIYAFGDSRSFTSLDTSANGATFHRRAASLLTGTTRVQIESEAVNGSTFTLMNGRLTADTVRIQAYQAAGIRVISTVLIGTNDDGPSPGAGGAALVNQAAVDSYYLTSLLPFYANLRALGVKVIACTEICNGRAPNYDGTSTGVITATTANAYGSLAGNTYTSWRYYLNALLLQHAADTTVYDAIADLGTATGFSTYAASSAVMGDVVHPNSLGHSDLAIPVAAKMQALLAP